jgi:hypothetical protein
MEAKTESGPTPDTGPKFRHWRSLSDGLMVTLIVVGPSFLFEELWRGRPLIDQNGYLWLVPGAIMAIGFYIGGLIAGRHRRSASGAFNQGLLVSGLTLALIFLADMIRRVVLSQDLTIEIFGLWLAAAAGGLLVGGLGGLSGRRRRRQMRQQSQMTRFF